MATIKLGATVSDIRGSIGGTVFSRNGGGAYARQRVKGTNPNTTKQQVVRAIMSTMSLAWLALSGTVRTAWNTYAKNVSMVNRLGDTINISGWNMYCRTKAVIELIGGTMPAAAPTVMSLAEEDPTVAIAPDASESNIDVSFDDGSPWASEVGGHLLCYQGLPQNPSINSYDGPFVYAGKIDGALTPPTSPATINSLYTIATGQKCFMQFRILRADGRLSNPFRATGTVSA